MYIGTCSSRAAKVVSMMFLWFASCNIQCFETGYLNNFSSKVIKSTKHILNAARPVVCSKKFIAGTVAALGACYIVAKVLHQRYFTLPIIKKKLIPPAGEDNARCRKKLFTWHPDNVDIGTLERLRAAGGALNSSQLITTLRRDCVAFDIFKHDDINAVLSGRIDKNTLRPIESGEIHWNDLIATLNLEIRELEEIKEFLRARSTWRIIGHYRLGSERDLEKTFQGQGVHTKEQERQMTSIIENAVDNVMTRPVGIFGRLLSTVLGAPNYDKIYPLYWAAYRRLAWLETFKGIIERAAASQGFNHIFTVIRDHVAYEIDPHQPATIQVPGRPVN